jgi:hypothetical protein
LCDQRHWLYRWVRILELLHVRGITQGDRMNIPSQNIDQKPPNFRAVFLYQRPTEYAGNINVIILNQEIQRGNMNVKFFRMD